MLILGLLLAAAALVVFGYMFFGTRDLQPLQIDLGVFTVELTPLHLYLLGAATLVVLVLGLLFLTIGLRAQRRRRREVKELRAAVRDGDGSSTRTGRRETAPVERRRDDPVAAPPYERDVPDSRAGGTPPPPPHPGTNPDVALPGDYPRDNTDPGTNRH